VRVPTCSVNEFKVEALACGSINLDFRIQASGLDEKTLGKLASLIRHDVLLTLTASDAPQQNAIEDMQHKVVTFPVQQAPLEEAGDAFAKAHAQGLTAPAKKKTGARHTKH
jgi:hypothetical protein